jgi:hypothetical protein
VNLVLHVEIISSTSGGMPGKTVAYDRDTTIDRIQQALEALVVEHVPAHQGLSPKIDVKKPNGALRRLIRRAGGVRTTTIKVCLAPAILGMDRARAIRFCQDAVPAIVEASVPADHLCSLVVALYRP